MKRYVQFFQAGLACGILVALIFSIPIVMASTPLRLDVSLMTPGHLLNER